jgi:acyl-coenzyme A thioesterase PaaI-like protein
MNPDQVLLDRIAGTPGAPLVLDTSPLFRTLQAELLAYDREKGEVKIAYRTGEAFYQGGGVVQGGIIGTMLDYSMGMALIGRLEPGFVPATMSYTINLLAPLRDERVIACASIDRAGRRSAFLSARLTTDAPSPVLIATGSSTASIVELRRG